MGSILTKACCPTGEQKRAPVVLPFMKILLFLVAFLLQQSASGQKPVTITFSNDYKDVYHLSLVIYTPDGKSQTRVSNLEPEKNKTYRFPVGTEIFIADRKQEAFAMKGNDLKVSGLKPTIILTEGKAEINVLLSSLASSN